MNMKIIENRAISLWKKTPISNYTFVIFFFQNLFEKLLQWAETKHGNLRYCWKNLIWLWLKWASSKIYDYDDATIRYDSTKEWHSPIQHHLTNQPTIRPSIDSSIRPYSIWICHTIHLECVDNDNFLGWELFSVS